MKIALVLIVLGTYAAAQESRPQMSVRVADEESASASQSAKPGKPPDTKATKTATQPWPKSKRAATKKKHHSSLGWCGKAGK